MINRITDTLNFQAEALVLRSERQRLIASNIANADTPGYAARDFDFKQALAQAQSQGVDAALMQARAATDGRTHQRHIPLPAGSSGSGGNTAQTMAYAVNSQPAMDNNTVDLDRERANFVDNAIRYEATLRFLGGKSKTLLSAIQGQ